jgi:integrase
VAAIGSGRCSSWPCTPAFDGEICGLHWADVDLAARTIVVRHNRVTVDGHVQS